MSEERESVETEQPAYGGLIDAAGRYLAQARDDLEVLTEKLRSIPPVLVEPLKKDDELENFTLAIHSSQTTTIRGDVGWTNRPPAMVTCPNCGSDVFHEHWRDPIDCPRCTLTLPYDEFTEVEVQYMSCPRCSATMTSGKRHPDVIDVPEWATCPNCKYHWDFDHDLVPPDDEESD